MSDVQEHYLTERERVLLSHAEFTMTQEPENGWPITFIETLSTVSQLREALRELHANLACSCGGRTCDRCLLAYKEARAALQPSEAAEPQKGEL